MPVSTMENDTTGVSPSRVLYFMRMVFIYECPHQQKRILFITFFYDKMLKSLQAIHFRFGLKLRDDEITFQWYSDVVAR